MLRISIIFLSIVAALMVAFGVAFFYFRSRPIQPPISEKTCWWSGGRVIKERGSLGETNSFCEMRKAAPDEGTPCASDLECTQSCRGLPTEGIDVPGRPPEKYGNCGKKVYWMGATL